MLDGDLDGLWAGVGQQRRAADAMLAAAGSLRGIAGEEVALAVEALDAQTMLLIVELETAQEGHRRIGAVLAAYAERLERAQHRAADADVRQAEALVELAEVEDRIGRLASARDALGVSEAAALADIELRLAEAHDRAERLRGRIDDALAEHRGAELDRDAAAETAMAGLDVLELARVGMPRPAGEGWREDIVARLVEGWQWLEATSHVVIARLDRVLVEVSGLLWETLLVLAGIGLGMHLAAGIGSGPPGWLLLSAVGTLLAASIVASVLSEVRAPTPTVRELAPRRRGPDAVADPAEALGEAAEVDALGRKARTVVKITAVPGDDGVVRWRVALPSTQDWASRFGDAGAVNDLDANLTLVLTPGLATQYERAVLEAMHQAGVGPQDPVLLVGFSQGGIMAGHLAAHRDDFAWSAVIAAGAPLGTAPIPDSVEVVAVEHLGDPVPRLELELAGGAGSSDRTGWTTIRAVSAASLSGLSGIHSAAQYDDTLQRHAARLARRHPGLAAFFAGPSGSRTRYYTWQE